MNGVRIRNLKQLVEVLRDTTDAYVTFRFQGKGSDTIVLKRADVPGATEEILSDNGIREQCSADIAPIWNRAKKSK